MLLYIWLSWEGLLNWYSRLWALLFRRRWRSPRWFTLGGYRLRLSVCIRPLTAASSLISAIHSVLPHVFTAILSLLWEVPLTLSMWLRPTLNWQQVVQASRAWKWDWHLNFRHWSLSRGSKISATQLCLLLSDRLGAFSTLNSWFFIVRGWL